MDRTQQQRRMVSRVVATLLNKATMVKWGTEAAMCMVDRSLEQSVIMSMRLHLMERTITERNPDSDLKRYFACSLGLPDDVVLVC